MLREGESQSLNDIEGGGKFAHRSDVGEKEELRKFPGIGFQRLQTGPS